MSYRTKLLSVFLGVAIVTNMISLAVMDRRSVHYLYDGYRAKMLSITTTAAVTLDGDVLKMIQTRSDENTPAWAQLHAALRSIRDANRRPDTYMQRVFAVVKAKIGRA